MNGVEAVEFNDASRRLYDLLFSKDFSIQTLISELSGGSYTADDVSYAAYKYVDDCVDELSERDFGETTTSSSYNLQSYGMFISRPFGEIVTDIPSAHMYEALKVMLEYGLDPNRIYDKEKNIMLSLRSITNGYIAADSLALLLENGGDPSIRIDGISLIRDTNFELQFWLGNDEDRVRYDALVHYWMVLVGYDAKLEDGRMSIDMCKGHDASELKQHRDFYYGAIDSDRVNDHMEICFFHKYSNWEIGRY